MTSPLSYELALELKQAGWPAKAIKRGMYEWDCPASETPISPMALALERAIVNPGNLRMDKREVVVCRGERANFAIGNVSSWMALAKKVQTSEDQRHGYLRASLNETE